MTYVIFHNFPGLENSLTNSVTSMTSGHPVYTTMAWLTMTSLSTTAKMVVILDILHAQFTSTNLILYESACRSVQSCINAMQGQYVYK